MMVFKKLILKAVPFIQGLPVFFIILISALPVKAQDSIKEEPTPEGMEVRNIGQTKVRIPKGMKLTGGKGVIIQEDLAEYVAREISNMQEHIAKIESKQEEQKKEITELKNYLEAVKVENNKSKKE